MKNKSNEIVKTITFNGVLAALYAIITIVCTPFAYGPIQFRVFHCLFD